MVAVPRFRLVRYAGLAGAILLAVGARFGGVLPQWRAGVTPAGIWQGEHGPLILGCWLVGTALLAGAWWAARDGVPSTRWVYVTTGLWLLPLLAAPPLGSRDVYSYACQGAVLHDGGNPYAGGVREFGCPWLDSVSPTWQDSPAPYGPVFVLLAGLAVAIGGTLVGTLAVLRLYAVLGVALTAACLPAFARRCGVAPQRALWLLLGCPIVAVHLVSGAHNDALMVGLLTAGLLVTVVGRGRPLPLFAGGVLLGLAVGVKVTAGVVIPFAMLAALAGAYRVRALLRDGVPVAAGAAFAVLAVTGVSGLGWGWVDGLLRSGDSVQWTSPPTAFGLTVDYAGRLFGADLDAVPVTRLVGLGLLAVLLVVLWWRARHADPVLGAGLALAATVALAPVFHPWYATWPLAVAAATAIAGRWLVVPGLLISFLTLPDGTNLARFSKLPGALAMTAFVLVVAVLGVRAARRRRVAPDRPELAEAAPSGR
ncbi:polyprenol phosphomannose-dependent alpha 1,6 mannosyltransferase MptB [Micromonospora sp. NBC_01796]|uniref:polyprenol phosphomannose-dependent alpha 1,6 mannosyltransferase MptB n=1 Tax=Micromonospora sp. NBC_01796 TaxID=2975987 RepID=UPI002DDC8572|nr:polyprenol phosphomannose-dependent alpha 1,6 mannosyltransferase MptB [Micromonospora sp. NBC_01796]WSA83281.1 polyprenol phosphomannose-dependent alpha 1,6 mannosyltransferase MptB [Micromonospora sp. NBC_01796]